MTTETRYELFDKFLKEHCPDFCDRISLGKIYTADITELFNIETCFQILDIRLLDYNINQMKKFFDTDFSDTEEKVDAQQLVVDFSVISLSRNEIHHLVMKQIINKLGGYYE